LQNQCITCSKESIKPAAKMKKFLLLLFLPTYLFSQEIQIRGSVVDSLTREKLPFATIQLKDANNQMVLGTIADTLGLFNFSKEAIADDSKILVSFLGFRSKEIPISLEPRQRRIDFGVIALSPEVGILHEVTVTGQRMVQNLVDRTVYWVDSLMLARAISTADVLSNIPEIVVNPLAHSVAIQGKENTLILINGINTGMSVDIRTINRYDIERIEVITSPPSGFDAEFDGVINIVLKQEPERGISGFIDGSIMPNGRFVEAYTGLVWGGRRFRASIGYWNNLRNFSWESSEMRSNSLTGLSHLSKSNTDRPLEIAHDIIANFDYHLSPNDFINFSSRSSIFAWNRDIYFNRIRINQGDSTILTPFTRQTSHNYFMGNYTLYYRRTLNEEGNSLTANVNLHYMDSEIGTTLLFEGQHPREYPEKGRKTSVNVRVEHINRLTDNLSLTTGLQSYFRNFSGALSGAILGNEFSNFRYSIYADLFANLAGIEMRMGMRAERNEMNFRQGGFPSTAQFGWFPSILLSRQLNQNHTIRAEYRRSTFYPSAWAFSPYTVVFDEMTSFTGNPQLIPSTRNAFSVSHSFRRGPITLNSSAFHRTTRNLISSASSYNPDNTSMITFNNSGSHMWSGFRVSGSITLFGFLEFRPDINLFFENFSIDQVTRYISSHTSTLWTTLILPGGVSIGALGSMAGRRLTLQGFIEPSYSIGAVLVMKQFVDQNLEISIGLRDLRRSEVTTFVFDGSTEQKSIFKHNAFGLSLRLIWSIDRGREQRMERIETNFERDTRAM